MFRIGDKVKIKKDIIEKEPYITNELLRNIRECIIFIIIGEDNKNNFLIRKINYDKDRYDFWMEGRYLELIKINYNKESNMKFTKSELDNGMVVELRNGTRFLYMNEQLIGKDMYSNILYYNDNLLNLSKTTTMLDIMKVYDVNWGTTYFLEDIFNNLILIWERKKEEIIISKEGKQYLELLLAKGYKWLARDKATVKSHNGLYAYESKPVRPMTISLSHNEGWGSCCEYTSVGKLLDEFDFVKWEDEQPWDIEDLLENCEVEN